MAVAGVEGNMKYSALCLERERQEEEVLAQQVHRIFVLLVFSPTVPCVSSRTEQLIAQDRGHAGALRK